MQKIYFKKIVDLNHRLKELVSISVDESISYKMETQGMRAVGSIMINGEYKDDNTKQSFHETIDLDILAQFDKITDKRDFHVKVEDFDYTLNEGNMALVIQACVYGVLDDEDRVIETSQIVSDEVQSDEDVALEIENLLREEDEIIMTPPVEEPILELDEEIVVPQKETKEVITKSNNEDEEDDEDIGTYYLYVVSDGDSYQSIAARYQVDEYQLKEYNHDRPLSKGAIVIVPYYA
ncbi:MAG: LysM domain-containing protein [Longibaculum muris]|uniref:LysM domain-containing protein n=1 Tax=Longibaculum muris TaxID=1796628 RepID=A0A4R3YYU0_9FIRM|nr:LysM domain-containing protein [Longibaculum muris]KXU52494.1 putative stage VI sporulation protein D [Candidatus Stoquefichus sp. KLE1796]MBS5368626.1 LysM peptidoglycan-binding domain-containing protein [Coprobacillus cateniformis]MCR1888582.1 LysM peptidoglycan-binding domain-containing protein [Longibaculum muris]MED9810709.1 LysM domain-containing protein [Longibaculum muris]TCV98437.1 LysM domain-containing protein [Longibaculum muris]